MSSSNCGGGTITSGGLGSGGQNGTYRNIKIIIKLMIILITDTND